MILFIAFMGCRTIGKNAPKAARIMDCFWEGKRNGAAARKIMRQDIVALMKEPLEDVRARLGIRKPVAYHHALKVLTAHGYSAETQLSDAGKLREPVAA